MAGPDATRPGAALVLLALNLLAFMLPSAGADAVEHERRIAFAEKPTAARDTGVPGQVIGGTQ
jgi:hypothetical protein